MKSTKYTKEQAEMLALLVLLGCAVVVLAFLYLVKPNLAKAATSKAELSKIEAEIAKLDKAKVELAKAKKEMKTLEAIVGEGEQKVFSGLESNPGLDKICVDAAKVVGLNPATGLPTSSPLLEFTDRTPGGQSLSRHYDEIRQTLDIQAVDFARVGRFLAAVENANEGLRVSHLELSNLALDPDDQEEGRVTAKVELSLLGVREPGGSSPEIDLTGAKLFDEGEKRNPFGPAGGIVLPVEDPLKRVRVILSNIKVRGEMGGTLLVEVPRKGTITVRKNETFVLLGTKMKYLSGVADSFVLEAVDYGKRYKLNRSWSGQYIITEEEVK